MDAVRKLEDKMAGLFKGAPPLPESGREGLAKAWPWIALIFGILQLLAAWGLWGLARTAERLNNYAQTLSLYYTNQATYGLSSTDRMVIYLGIAVLVVDGIILLMAYPQLKKRTRRGWDLLFLGALINLAYSIISLFIDERGVGSFIFSLVSSAIGFYLLFQVKSKFGRSTTAAKSTETKKA